MARCRAKKGHLSGEEGLKDFPLKVEAKFKSGLFFSAPHFLNSGAINDPFIFWIFLDWNKEEFAVLTILFLRQAKIGACRSLHTTLPGCDSSDFNSEGCASKIDG